MTNYDLLHYTYYRRRLPGGRPKVTTVVDMIPEMFPSGSGWSPHGRKLEQVRESALVFVISETTKRDLLTFAPEVADRVVVTPLAVDEVLFGNFSGPAPGDRDYLLYVGQRSGYKNFQRFVHAIAGLLNSEQRLCLLCVGGGRFSPFELEDLKRAGLETKVSQRTVSDMELPAIYASAKALVIPSLYEGFGLPLLEAFAAGCPVCASLAGALPEVAGEAATFFDPQEERSIEEAVRRVVASSTLRDELRHSGRRRLAAFSWDRTANLTAAAYWSIL